MKKFFSFAIFLLVFNFLFTSIHAQCPNPGGSESDFGDGVWKVNVYELGISYDTASSWLPEYYSGFYNDSSLNFDSRDKWDDNSDPTTAPGYTGCEIPYPDYMSWSAKREGFPCGIYRVDIINHDDYADLFIDGVRVWGEQSLNSNTVVNAWTGALNSFSKVEFRIAEDEGFTNGALSFTYLGSTGSFISVTGHPVVCTGQSYTLTSTITGASYGWSNGETTNPAHGSESGSYFVTVTDDDGCPVTADPVNISVLPDAAPVAHITVSSNSTCNWEMITLSSDSTSGNTWSTTANTQNISLNIPGDYILTVSNNAGCFDQATAHITGGFIPPAPPVNSTMGVCPGSIVKLDAGGLAPGGKTASFNNVWVQVWQDIPENDFTIEMWVKTTELTTGLFSARDFSAGWDRDLYLTNGQLYAQVGGGHILNSGISINDGKWHHIALTVQTGVGTRIYVDGGLAPNTDPYDHADFNQAAFYLGLSLPAGGSSNLFKGEMDNVRIWSEARSENDIRNNMALKTPLSSTNLLYHCSFNGNLNAEVGTLGGAFTGFGPLNFPDADYYTYTWTGDGAPAPSSSEIIAVPANDGAYSVTATANNCDASAPATITVAVASAIPVSHINASSPSICDGNPVTLSSDSTTSNSWSTNESTPSINVSEAGDYQLVVTNGGCSDSSTIHIGIGFTPPTPVASNSGPVCQNSSVDLIASGLAPGGSVARFNGVVGDLVYVQQDIPETDFTVEMWVKTSAAQTGIFSATNGFGQDDRDLYLVNGQLLVRLTSVNSFNSGVIINDNVWHHIALTVESGVGLKVYVDGELAPNTSTYDHSDYTFQNGFTLGKSSAASFPFTFNGYMDNVRIWSEPRSQADIRNNMLLETPSSITNLIYLCTLNGNTQATIGNNSSFENGVSYVNPDYYTYTWTGEGAPASSVNETQSTSALSANGIYYVTASVNGCPPSVSALTMVTVTPATSYYADVDEDGYGDANVLVQTCDAAPEGYITNHTDCNDGNEAIYPGAIDVCNSVDDNCNNVVDENAIVATIVAPTGTVSVCKGTPVSFTANNGSGIAYQWIRNSVNIAGATNMEYATQKKGKYQVIETNAFGCTSTSASVKVNILQPPAAVIIANGNLDICNTGSIMLQANGGTGLTYVWTKGKDTIAGATSQSYTTNKKGSYHCIVTNANGCSKTSNVLKVTKDCDIKEPYADADAATTDLTVYPNPTTGRFMVDLNSSAGDDVECKIMVINMLGQVIYATDASMSDGALQQEINLSSGTTIAGVYFLRVLLDEEMYETKLVIQY